MPESTPSTAPPYESARDLRTASAALVQALDQRLGRSATRDAEAAALAELEPQVREFLARSVAAGAVIEDIEQRSACQVLVDYWVSRLERAGLPVERRDLVDFDAARLPRLRDEDCPYVGLDPFRDGTHFFGREKATASLVERVEKTPLVVVQGASGSGKSSLVMGGALPRLRDPAHDPRYVIVGPIQPGPTVLRELAAALARASVTPAPGVDAAAALLGEPNLLAGWVTAAGVQAVLLVIDQFEEIFTLGAPQEGRALAAALAALLDAAPTHRVLLTMREEFGAQLDALEPLRPLLTEQRHARFSMKEWQMGFEDLKAAVERPAAAVNLQFQPGIVDDMVNGLAASGDTALPLLQFALRELWRLRDHNRITWEVYDRIGRSPLVALKRHADAIYGALADEDQREFRRILLELVRVDRLLESYRQQVLRSRLQAAGSAQTDRVLALLAQNDFVRVTPTADGRDAVVEVKHEALLRNWPEYIDWINDKREQVRRRIAVSEAAQRWVQAGRSRRHGLLTAWQLEEARALGELQGVEAEFVAASARAVRRQSTWSRARYVLATIVAMLAVWASLEWSDALRGAVQRDLREQMAAAKEASIAGRLGHAFVRAVTAAHEARNQPPDVDGRVLRFEALATLLAVHARTGDVRRLFVDESAVYRAAVFQPGRERPVLAFAGSRGVVYLSAPDVTAVERQLEPCVGRLVTALAFDPAGNRLAAGCDDGTVALWSTAGWTPLAGAVLDGTVWTIAFSGDGRMLAAGGSQNHVRLWALDDGGAAQSGTDLAGASGSVWSLAFDPKGDLLLVGDGKGRVLRCAPETGAGWACAEAPAQRGGPSDGEDAIRALAFSADGTAVAVGHWRGEVDVFDRSLAPESRRPLDLGETGGPVFSLAFFPYCGANYLAIARGAGLAYANAAGASAPAAGLCPRLAPASIGDDVSGVSADAGSQWVAAATQSGYVAVFDPTRPQDRLRSKTDVPARPNEQFRGAILADDSRSVRIAVAAYPVGAGLPSVTVLGFDRRDGAFVEVAPRRGQLEGEGAIRRLAASPQSRRLATLAWMEPDAASDKEEDRKPVVKVWTFDGAGDIAAAPLATLGAKEFDNLVPKRIALSPDGRWLMVSFEVDRVLLKDLGGTGRLEWIDTGLGRVREIAFSADGRFFAAGGGGGKASVKGQAAADEVRVWRVAPTRKGVLDRVELPPLQLTSLARLVQEVAFASEGHRSRLPAPLRDLLRKVREERRVDVLVSAGRYGEIDVWNLDRGGLQPPRRVNSQPVWLLAFDPARSILAASDSQFRVRLWHTETRDAEPIQLSRASDRGGVPGLLGFGAQGDWLVAGAWRPNAGGELQFWDLDPASLQAKACALLRFPRSQSGESDRMAAARSACPES